MPTFYRRLVLRSGDAGSPVALCPRDELFTRSKEEAGHYLSRLDPLFHVAWFDYACEWEKPAGSSSCRAVRFDGESVPFGARSLM